MLFSEQFSQTEKTGYLNEDFRLFHIKDQTKKEFAYHYHDFHKVVIFISGKSCLSYRRKSLSANALGYPPCEPPCDPPA